jgi:hypothetical protein
MSGVASRADPYFPVNIKAHSITHFLKWSHAKKKKIFLAPFIPDALNGSHETAWSDSTIRK